MPLSRLGPVLILGGFLWCGIALWLGNPAVPDVAVALFAGLLFQDGRRWGGMVLALLALRMGTGIRFPDPGLFLVMEWLRLAAMGGAGIAGHFLRPDPRWWKIGGVLLVLSLVQEQSRRTCVCWEAYAADLCYAVLALLALALVLRAEKRGSAEGVELGEPRQ